jgi:two-component system OmpR family response regulator
MRAMKQISDNKFPAHILVIEDDHEIRALVRNHLNRAGWKVSLARDGREADSILAASKIDVVLLDLMLPGEDGLSICRRLRAISTVPIMIVSAKGDDVDRVIGLEVGADDYMSKPFNPRELEARIKAMLRRSQMVMQQQVVQADKLFFDDWCLDIRARQLLWQGDVQVHLTPAEFDLLRVFVERPGLVLSRDQLLELTPGRNMNATGRSVDILVSRLRRKLENGDRKKLIHTVRTGGYEFLADVREESVA